MNAENKTDYVKQQTNFELHTIGSFLAVRYMQIMI